MNEEIGANDQLSEMVCGNYIVCVQSLEIKANFVRNFISGSRL